MCDEVTGNVGTNRNGRNIEMQKGRVVDRPFYIKCVIFQILCWNHYCDVANSGFMDMD